MGLDRGKGKEVGAEVVPRERTEENDLREGKCFTFFLDVYGVDLEFVDLVPLPLPGHLFGAWFHARLWHGPFHSVHGPVSGQCHKPNEACVKSPLDHMQG